MRNRFLVVLALAVALLAASGTVFAHHGSGISYDVSKMVTHDGVVTEFQWRNPHVYVLYDVKDAQGERGELGSRDSFAGGLRKPRRLDQGHVEARRQNHHFGIPLEDRHGTRTPRQDCAQRQGDHRRYRPWTSAGPVKRRREQVDRTMQIFPAEMSCHVRDRTGVLSGCSRASQRGTEWAAAGTTRGADRTIADGEPAVRPA